MLTARAPTVGSSSPGGRSPGAAGGWAAPVCPAGEGTPWEDRGRVGVARAFALTCRAVLVSPRYLFLSIRRPDSLADAPGFVVLCAALGSLSLLVHATILLARYRHQPDTQVIEPDYWRLAVLGALAILAAAWPVFRAAARLFHRLTAFDLPHPAPPGLVANLLSYTLAGAVFAPLPFLGPLLAVAATGTLMVTAARVRLHASTAAAVIATVMTLAAVAAAVLLAGYAVSFVYGHTVGWPVEMIEEVGRRHG